MATPAVVVLGAVAVLVSVLRMTVVEGVVEGVVVTAVLEVVEVAATQRFRTAS